MRGGTQVVAGSRTAFGPAATNVSGLQLSRRSRGVDLGGEEVFFRGVKRKEVEKMKETKGLESF
jgi:hypothetical protein